VDYDLEAVSRASPLDRHESFRSRLQNGIDGVFLPGQISAHRGEKLLPLLDGQDHSFPSPIHEIPCGLRCIARVDPVQLALEPVHESGRQPRPQLRAIDQLLKQVATEA